MTKIMAAALQIFAADLIAILLGPGLLLADVEFEHQDTKGCESRPNTG
jgi:hypothetical protein